MTEAMMNLLDFGFEKNPAFGRARWSASSPKHQNRRYQVYRMLAAEGLGFSCAGAGRALALGPGRGAG
jgi:hypothetical protein